MSSVAEVSAHGGKPTDDASEDARYGSKDGSRQEEGELQQNDYDVETVERVYRFVSTLPAGQSVDA
jgi:hypothetical protein